MGQIEHDNYPTPETLAREIVQQMLRDGIIPAVVIEPSCGAGAFIKAAREAWPNARIIGVDIIEDYRQSALANGADEFVCAPWEQVAEAILEAEQEHGRVVVIGNPPFSLAQLHIEVTLRYLAEFNCLDFLLRLSFFGSTKRAKNFWPQHRPFLNALTPIAGRPSYRVFKTDKVTGKRKKGSTTDNSEYGVYHFIKTGERFQMSMPPFINAPLVWKKEREPAAKTMKNTRKVREAA